MSKDTTMDAPQKRGAGEWLSQQWRVLAGRVRGQWRPQALFLFDHDGAFDVTEPVIASFGQWCELNPGAVCSVGLSSRWLLHSVSRIDSDHDAAHDHALQQWSHYLDIEPAVFESDWVLRQLVLPHVSLMCAVPRVLIEGLQDHAGQHGVRLDWVGPWWAACAQAWMADLPRQDEARLDTVEFVFGEPGLLTHVRAQANAEGSAQRDGQHGYLLSEVWTEVSGTAVPSVPANRGMCMPAPMAEQLTGLSYENHVWSHPGVGDMLVVPTRVEAAV